MTSTQIKTATLQIAALETKIDNLQSGLLEEETRNAEY